MNGIKLFCNDGTSSVAPWAEWSKDLKIFAEMTMRERLFW